MSSKGSQDGILEYTSRDSHLLDGNGSVVGDNATGRTRSCTDKGQQFFQAECLRNRERLRKTILKDIEKIEGLLVDSSLGEATISRIAVATTSRCVGGERSIREYPVLCYSR